MSRFLLSCWSRLLVDVAIVGSALLEPSGMASPAMHLSATRINGDPATGRSERDEDRYGFFVDEEEQSN